MSKLKEMIKSPHIHIALATGASIIIMAYVSKRVLSEPMSYLALAIPPFVTLIFETLLDRHKESKFMTTWYWVVAIFVATALVILFHAV